MGANQIWVQTINVTKIGHTTPTTTGEKNIQKILETLIYYAKSVEPKILVSLGLIASNQAKSNETNPQTIKQLFYFCATLPYVTM